LTHSINILILSQMGYLPTPLGTWATLIFGMLALYDTGPTKAPPVTSTGPFVAAFTTTFLCSLVILYFIFHNRDDES
jgi:hypothetical protein